MKRTTDILAIRHGETQWNAEGRYQGQADVALNDAGLAQARRIAAAFAAAPIEAIYSSDLARAYQTAVELAQAHAAPLVSVADLREQHYGVFQGMTGSDIAQRWPEASARWHRREADFGPEGGETRNAFRRRCIGALERFARAHVGRTIAVVCHGGVLDCLYRAASSLGMEVRRTWALENAAVSRLQHGPEGFKIIDWGNTTHLDRRATDDLPDLFPAP